jgi:hypothetical protein
LSRAVGLRMEAAMELVQGAFDVLNPAVSLMAV